MIRFEGSDSDRFGLSAEGGHEPGRNDTLVMPAGSDRPG